LEAEAELKRCEAARERLRSQLQEAEADFDRWRKAARKSPEAALRSELAQAQGE